MLQQTPKSCLADSFVNSDDHGKAPGLQLPTLPNTVIIAIHWKCERISIQFALDNNLEPRLFVGAL